MYSSPDRRFAILTLGLSHVCTGIISDGVLPVSGCPHRPAGAVVQSLDNTAGRAIPPLRLGIIQEVMTLCGSCPANPATMSWLCLGSTQRMKWLTCANLTGTLVQGSILWSCASRCVFFKQSALPEDKNFCTKLDTSGCASQAGRLIAVLCWATRQIAPKHPSALHVM